MLKEFSLKTAREGLYNITAEAAQAILESGIKDGLCTVFCPHTTAGITINENADPDVIHDLLLGLDKAFPDRREFLHSEGNSSAHLKSSAIGAEKTLIVKDGKLLLGQWQCIYFCEFDGPRSRKFYVNVK
ncbi:MAG: YjbQ family protein [Christensenellaceae bacterium]|nr:YjbQ family protein [Christensenellaceae bacterium]